MKNGLGDLKKRHMHSCRRFFSNFFSLLSASPPSSSKRYRSWRIPTLSRVLSVIPTVVPRSSLPSSVVNFSLLFPHPPLSLLSKDGMIFSLALNPAYQNRPRTMKMISRGPSSAVVRSQTASYFLSLFSIIALLLLPLSIRAGIYITCG